MRGKMLGGVGVGLLVGAAVGFVMHDAMRPAEAQGAPMTFEYQVVNLREEFGAQSVRAADLERLYNQFGREGWRINHQAGGNVVFERPRRGAPRTVTRPPAPAPAPAPGPEPGAAPSED